MHIPVMKLFQHKNVIVYKSWVFHQKGKTFTLIQAFGDHLGGMVWKIF